MKKITLIILCCIVFGGLGACVEKAAFPGENSGIAPFSYERYSRYYSYR